MCGLLVQHGQTLENGGEDVHVRVRRDHLRIEILRLGEIAHEQRLRADALLCGVSRLPQAVSARRRQRTDNRGRMFGTGGET
ncbi:MAG: hypothetical protein WDM96_13060 [Lacunisphaera sp.]